MPNYNKKGVILFLVIIVVILAAILATSILRIISSQSRLTHHQISRTQGQYAAKAAVIYAMDKLRRNDDPSWSATTPAAPVTKTMCRSGCDVNEPDLPNSIQRINITIYDPADPHPEHQGISGTRKITATADYTYTS